MEVIRGEKGSDEEGSIFFVLGENDRTLDTFGLQLVAQFMVAKAQADNPGKTYLFRECAGELDDDGREREIYELVDVDAAPSAATSAHQEQPPASLHDAA